MTADPFTALGLPARPDLTDDDVRAAWRRVAAATHPDRADGGDPARFAVAAAAYTDLRTRSGRGEAYADLATGSWSALGTAPGPAPAAVTTSGSGTGPGGDPVPPPPAAAARRGGRPAPGRYSAAGLASRMYRGRPALLALRIAITAGVIAAAFAIVGTQPAAAGLTAGALTWLLLTARHDIAPPGS